MNKDDLVFIVGLTLLASIIWVVGELIMGIWVAVYPWVHIVWTTSIIVITLVISVWHSFKMDKVREKQKNKKTKK